MVLNRGKRQMVDQVTFNRAEEILDVLDEQRQHSDALRGYLVSIAFPPDQIAVLLNLITAQNNCGNVARGLASKIAKGKT